MPDDPIRTEEAIIQEFLAPLAAGYPGALGLRDDCALFTPEPGRELVLKTDAIAEGVHFLPDDPPRDIGWKALAVNVSDLAAKAARPEIYLMSLAFPAAPTRDWMAAFAAGLAEAQAAFGIRLAGGDTDRRPGPISITPTVIGSVPAGGMVRRGAARDGDLILVSGTLGDAGLGLRLRREPAMAERWGLGGEDALHLIRRYLRPEPRLALSKALEACASAAMDLSDGLVKDLGRMCRASGVGAAVDYERLPLSAAFAVVGARDPGAAALALPAGDDYEVLCAVPPERAARFAELAAAEGVAVRAVGSFRAGTAVELLDRDGQPVELPAQGWDHF